MSTRENAQTLILQKSVYSSAAVKNAVRAFRRAVKIACEEDDRYYKIHFLNIDQEENPDELIGEFSNYVLVAGGCPKPETAKQTGPARKSEYDHVYNFREFKNRVLLTNEIGDHIFVTREEFSQITAPDVDERSLPVYDKLIDSGMLMARGAVPAEARSRFIRKNLFTIQGPMLFIMVLTHRCNMKCVYCHAGVCGTGAEGADMTVETAKKVIDIAFQSPSRSISIEFQGGEALLNWKTLRFATEYAIEKNKKEQKKLYLTVVSNLRELDDEKLDYLVRMGVGLCTSIDGPEWLHRKNRGGGYGELVEKTKKATRKFTEKYPDYSPAALVTITRDALAAGREIVDTYASLGLSSIHLRQLNPIGFAGGALDEIGYSEEEFLVFYRDTLEYIIEYNRAGNYLVERATWLFLMKIFGEYDPNYMDLRSPCGAGIGQIAFNYDGRVYTCDEGRMLAMQGDESFAMGSVYENGYDELINAPVVRAVCMASMLDFIPGCATCAYKPYCGVCPLLNYVETGSLATCVSDNRRHRINEGMLDFIFEKLDEEESKRVMINWLERGITGPANM